jgi:hypothetical protein
MTMAGERAAEKWNLTGAVFVDGHVVERRRDDIEIVGLEECRRMFIAAPAESPES